MKDIEVFHDEGEVDMSVIDEFEKKTGHKLPKLYKDLLSKHNRLYPERSYFSFFHKQLNREVRGDISFLGFGNGLAESANINNAQWHDVYGREDLIAFGKTASGDFVCFDYRSDFDTDEPPVVLMCHDFFADDDKMLVCPISDNFERFISSLYGDEE